jgi:tetratricopeptide (TPR) repeat protein
LAKEVPVAAIASSALVSAARVLTTNPPLAAALAREVLKLEPENPDAALILAKALRADGRFYDAITALKPLSQSDAADVRILLELGGVLAAIGETSRAGACHLRVLQRHPELAKIWLVYGHVLKTLGKQQEALAAYRKAIAREPSLGEGYWSIANLKTVRFKPDEIVAMRAQLAKPELSPAERVNFEFALGKALEDSCEYADSFAHYERANALHRASHAYDHTRTRDFFARLKATFTSELFALHRGLGSPAQDPIFVVGMLRSGSTLVEQILASHSAVEATSELHHIAQIAHGVGPWEKRKRKPGYPEAVTALVPDELKSLGEQYLARAKQHRRLGRLYFIDKMPNNFAHIGFIHLILPNAKIIDVRRDPRACGWSCFTQHFARGMPYLYSLEDIEQYYADYADLLAHYDAVLPERIYPLRYEDMVANPEAEIRRLLSYCGLQFEENCLAFHRTARAVHTPSSEQVRQPIFRAGLDRWRPYRSWLPPLRPDATSAHSNRTATGTEPPGP